MKISDLEFDEKTLERYNENSFYQINKPTLLEDFARLYSGYLGLDIPENCPEAVLANTKTHKTDLFVAFLTGHLNFLDLESSLAKSLHSLKKPNSGLILPEHLVK